MGYAFPSEHGLHVSFHVLKNRVLAFPVPSHLDWLHDVILYWQRLETPLFSLNV